MKCSGKDFVNSRISELCKIDCHCVLSSSESDVFNIKELVYIKLLAVDVDNSLFFRSGSVLMIVDILISVYI